MSDTLPARPRKGRGAVSNPVGRYERHAREAVDDGWWADDELPPLRTTVEEDKARGVIARNDSPDVPFAQSINPYRGCEHGCIYCYARPYHSFIGLGPGLDFETRLFAKRDAAKALADELARPGYRCQPVAIGTATDPYQPVERRLGVTRTVLEVLAACRHPLTITTKSALVVRDLDLLAPMAGMKLVHVSISLTTLDPELARSLEPRASTPAKRLKAVAALAAAGVPVGVMTAPVIPGLTDHELEGLLEAAARAGAATAAYTLLRLPAEVAPLFEEWLATRVPERAKRVMSLLRQCRAGALNDSRFGRRMTGRGEYAALIGRRFALACRRLGLNARDDAWALDCGRFRPPPRPGQQLRLW